MISRISPPAGSNLPDTKFSIGSMSRGYYIGRIIPLFESEIQGLIETGRMIDTVQTRLHCASLTIDKAIAMQQVVLQSERLCLEKKNLIEIDRCEVFRSSLSAFIGSLEWLIGSLNGPIMFDFFPPCPKAFRGEMTIGKKMGVLQGFVAANEQAEILCEPVRVLIIEIAEAIALQQFELRRKAMGVVIQSRTLANRVSRLHAELLGAVFTSTGIFRRASVGFIASEAVSDLRDDLETCWKRQVDILFHAVGAIDNIMRESGIHTGIEDLLKQKPLIQGDAFFEITQSFKMNSELGLRMLILGRFRMLSEGLNFLGENSRIKLETCTFSKELLSSIEEAYENFRTSVNQDRDEFFSLMTKHTQEKGNELLRIVDIILDVHTRVLEAKIKSITDRLIVCQFDHLILDDLVLNAMQQYCQTPMSLRKKELRLLRSSERSSSSSSAHTPLDWRSSWYFQPAEQLIEKYQVTLPQIIESFKVLLEFHERMLQSIAKCHEQYRNDLKEHTEKAFIIVMDSELGQEKHENLMKLIKDSRKSIRKGFEKASQSLGSIAGSSKIDPELVEKCSNNFINIIQHISNFIRGIIDTDGTVSMQALTRSSIRAIRRSSGSFHRNNESSSSSSSTSGSS